jgi:hypothetical protein
VARDRIDVRQGRLQLQVFTREARRAEQSCADLEIGVTDCDRS